jgi:hypothetical protein
MSITNYAQDNNSSHYVFNNFIEGKVLMNDGNIYEKSLNYNKLTREMIFKSGNDFLAISEADKIDTVFVKNKKFIRLNNLFLEVIYDSDYDVLLEQKSKIEETLPTGAYGESSSTSSVNTLTYLKGNYQSLYRKLDIGNDIKIKSYKYYSIKKEDDIKSFNSLRSLYKIYPLKRKVLRKFIKENEIDYMKNKDIVKTIKFLETTY